MLTKLEQKVADFIAAEQLFSAGEKILLAVSGGADSTALLHAMVALRFDIYCAHINHQLRGDEAQRDEDFVIEQCQNLKVPLITVKINVRDYAKKTKLSIETAARNLRIKNLVEIAKERNCVCIATAHHKNDNAETILQRLSRGTGLRGLCGIWPIKEFENGARFIRPLLCATRDEIIQCLNSRNLKWCLDRTNKDFAYKRNFIRHLLLPDLQKNCAGSLVDELSELAKASRGLYRQICRSADAAWPEIATVDEKTVTLDSAKLVAQLAEVKIEIVRKSLAHLGCSEQDITERHYSNILRLSENKTVQLPGSIEASRQDTKIVFMRSPAKSIEAGKTAPLALNVPGKIQFGSYAIDADVFEIEQGRFDTFKKTKTNFVEWFDFDKLKLPLEVRFRKPGDKFRPLGLKAEKKVGKFLTSAKVSHQTRRKAIIFADSEKIIWLAPVRISEEVKITSRTKNVLQLEICPRPI